MSKNLSRPINQSKKKWLIFFIVLSVLAVFHRPLILTSCKLVLQSTLPELKYEKMFWENQKIVLANVQLKNESFETKADQIELRLSGVLFPFQPKITFIQPQVQFSKLHSNRNFAFKPFYRNCIFCPQWEIKKGSIVLPSGESYFYSMTPGTSKEEIGTVYFALSEESLTSAFFEGSLSLQKDQLYLNFAIQSEDLNHILPLTAFIEAEEWRQWEEASGEISVQGCAQFDSSFQCVRLDFGGVLNSLKIQNSKVGLAVQLESCLGTFSYPASAEGTFFWDKLAATLDLKQMQCAFDGLITPQPFKIKNLECQLDLVPLQEPHVFITGALNKENKELKFNISGKGSLQEDDTFWSLMECQIESESKNTMQALLSVCRHEKDEDVFQLKIDQAEPDHLNFLFSFLQIPGVCKRGILNASMTSIFKKGACLQTTLENCSLTDFHFNFLEEEKVTYKNLDPNLNVLMQCGVHSIVIPQASLEGELLYSGKWNWDALHLSMQDAQFATADLNVTAINAEVQMEEGVLLPSQLKAECGLVHMKLDFLNKEIAEVHFFGDMASLIGKKISQASVDHYPFSLKSTLSLHPDKIHCTVVGDLHGDSLIADVNLENYLFKNAKIEVSQLTPKSYSAFLAVDSDLLEHFCFENVTIQLKHQNDLIQIPYFHAKCQDIELGGSGVLDFSSDAHFMFCIDQISGEVTALMTTLRRLPQFSAAILPTKGQLNSESRFFFERKDSPEKNHTEWQLRALLDDLHIPLNESTHLTNGICEFSFDSKTEKLLFHQASADLKLNSQTQLQVAIDQFEMQPGKNCNFEWALHYSNEEVARFSGSAQKNLSSLWEVMFQHPVSHFKGLPLDISKCTLSETCQLLLLQMKPHLKGKELKVYSHFLKEIGIDLPLLSSIQESEIEGLIEAKIDCQNLKSGFSFFLTSTDLKVKGKPYSPFILSGQKMGEAWSIEQMRAPGFSLRAKGQANRIAVPEFNLSHKGATVKGSADFFVEEGLNLNGECRFVAELSDPFGLAIKTQHPVKFTFSKERGLTCEEMKVHCTYDKVKQAQFVLNQFNVRYEKNQLLFKAKTQLQQQPLWTSLQLDLTKELKQPGVIKFFDKPQSEGLAVFFSLSENKARIDNAKGSCYGISCDLHSSSKYPISDATVLSGAVNFDGMSLSALLPEKMKNELQALKIGKGYSCEGDLILYQDRSRGFEFKGKIEGNHFELLGFELNRMEATIDVSPEQLFLSNLRIEDDSGAMGIKKIELTRKTNWDLYIPQIVMREFIPSRLKKLDGLAKELKPFTIKHFLLQDVRGTIGNLSQLEASGHLTFTNQFKKEFSIFDIPLEAIKDFGLDPGLLTPIQGELDVELRGDKFYLLSLKNAFSEGQRSEFYLPMTQTLSYIDFNGKVHIDLKLRQDVMLKLIEPFLLTIRGSIDKPRYGVQF